ncbi:hypothetical protein PR202_ga26443 [Eleusine coracana subsp. coracana]|uniref:Uncharacterized protein n=1 Tax=Eleusine coracana subsp. coracana TaxID=191504 RepID=A0AAV5DE30_ELECO|nr:hypothetical protein PR202_ga26443 [Eleusine coracana subsp. coracana]
MAGRSFMRQRRRWSATTQQCDGDDQAYGVGVPAGAPCGEADAARPDPVQAGACAGLCAQHLGGGRWEEGDDVGVHARRTQATTNRRPEVSA